MNRFKLAVALLPMIGCFGAAIAADLGPYEPVETETQPLEELGTGWYLRGDVGIGIQDQAQITADIVPP
ncbi:MAG: porin family protein, partial [Methylobacteriaceae bacterium]|nr:porin family protein [Methylobacteriaceae bacterium]